MTDAAIRPAGLATLLDDLAPQVRILSLDCFDTLVWRDVNKPVEVFAELKAMGAGVDRRVWAEHAARRRAQVRQGRSEVTLQDIYRALRPNADAATLAALAAAELAAEARHCFAFQPTVALIRAAKRRGLKVVVVSDTYLDEIQLRTLIAEAAGDDVAALIDRIFCSSAYGRSKADGLFRDVLKELRATPREVLHLGDNPVADVEAPAALQIPAVRLRQFDPAIEQRLRLEAVALAMIDPRLREVAVPLQPHRAALAMLEPAGATAEAELGFATLGPVMHGFAAWLKGECDEIAARTGGRTHVLFLMRDGHLPKLAFEALHPDAPYPTAAIELSRFTATAASLAGPDDVVRYLAMAPPSADVDTLAAQLLLTRDDLRQLPRPSAPVAARRTLMAEALKPALAARIARRSASFAERLLAHIRARVDVHPGDTLVLADLGYNGTVQTLAEPLLRRALGVEVEGRYLLLREQEQSGAKRGLLDGRHYDANALGALCEHVSVLEQLCTAPVGSVVDYTADGEPIRKQNDIKASQSAVRDQAQQGCLDFVRQAAVPGGSPARADAATGALTGARHAAAASLARLMFLPMAQELEALAAFQHDVNMGTREIVPLFDPETAERGLKHKGMFYLNNSRRMYLPGELRSQGLPVSLTWMAQRRFGLDLRYADFQSRPLQLPILVADGQDVAMAEAPAFATHDGFMAANIPIGRSRLSIGVMFGRLLRSLQIDSVGFVLAQELVGEQEKGVGDRLAASPVFEGMTEIAPGLYDCREPAAFMMIPAPPPYRDRELVLSVVFRPLVARAAEAAEMAGSEPREAEVAAVA